MTVTEDIERLCVERASSEEIKRVAVKQGMQTLRQDGLEKVLMGLTTIEEVGRDVAGHAERQILAHHPRDEIGGRLPEFVLMDVARDAVLHRS